MTLQAKFVLLVSLLALAIAASGVGAFWAFRFLSQELRTPFQSSTSVLEGLRDVKRCVENQGVLLAGAPVESSNAPSPPNEPVRPASPDAPPQIPGFRALLSQPAGTRLPPLPPGAPEKLNALAAAANHAIAVVESDEWHRRQIGATWRNIKDRILAMQSLAASAVVAPEPDARNAQRLQAMRACYDIHELIERSEERILFNAGITLSHAGAIQTRLLLWLASVVLLGVLMSVLSVILLRRWVQRPVAALRDAAAHIAAGDLTFRVPVSGRDELALLSAEVNHMAQMVHVMQEERVERERLAAIGGMVRRLVHNVRNPLAGIRGLAEVTRMDFPRGSEPRENLDLIVSTADTFERWLNELLSVTNPANINLQECNVRDWLRAVIEVHRPMAQSKGVELVVDLDAAPQSAAFDPTHLDHALAAILSNAIEASPAGSKVTISCRTDPGRSEWEVQIADQGPGVPRELSARIFEPNFTTKRHGTGMGLAMAQQVVRAHSGRIRVESPVNSEIRSLGAVFRLCLPLRTPVGVIGTSG